MTRGVVMVCYWLPTGVLMVANVVANGCQMDDYKVAKGLPFVCQMVV